MNVPDPLSGQRIISTRNLLKDRLVVTLASGQVFALEAAAAHRAEDLRRLSLLLLQLTPNSLCFQQYCGLTVLRDSQFHVFQLLTGDTLRITIEKKRLQNHFGWDPEVLESYMQQMAFAVHTLHCNQLIHWKLNPRHFYFCANNRVRLGGLTHVRTIDARKFEVARRKELTWLGRCFVSMLILVDFEVLLEWDMERLLASCRTNQLFRGTIAMIVEGTLQGIWQDEYLAVQSTETNSTVPNVNRDFPVVFLPPPSFDSSVSSISKPSQQSVMSELSVSSEPPDLELLTCCLCQHASTLVTPCKHHLCLPCFSRHCKEVAKRLSSELDLVCPECKTLLDKDFVFECIASDKETCEMLNCALLSILLLICPHCERPQSFLPDNPATNVTCEHENCRKRFCSQCKGKPHQLGPCPSGKEEATLSTS